jgi:TRAP-type C4-dicarboxylate transport system permease small subunit
MEKIAKFFDKIANWGGYISSVFMIFIVALILIEIFLRTFFHTSTLISDEYSAYFFVVVVMLGLAYTFKDEGHIRITIILGKLNPKLNKILDIICLLIALALTVFMFYYSMKMVIDTRSLDMRADSIAETPVYIPQIALPVGYFLFILSIIGKIMRRIRK